MRRFLLLCLAIGLLSSAVRAEEEGLVACPGLGSCMGGCGYQQDDCYRRAAAAYASCGGSPACEATYSSRLESCDSAYENCADFCTAQYCYSIY
jgi:hypothetical protein